MDARTLELYLGRAAAATSVRELHAAVRDVRRAHPEDPDADRVESVCWDRALDLLTRGALDAHGTGRPARPAPRRPRRDWKEHAARMTPLLELVAVDG